MAFYVWTRPRFGVFSHNTLCLGCGFTQVGYVYRDGGKRETPVSGSDIWAPPAPPSLPDDDEEDDDDE